MSTILVHLERKSPSSGNLIFWEAIQVTKNRFRTKWGTVGSAGKVSTSTYPLSILKRTVKMKIAKGYSETSKKTGTISTKTEKFVFSKELKSISEPTHGFSESLDKIPDGLGGHFVPKLDKHYHFQDFSKNVCLDLRDNKNVLLVGHTGCGKTSLIQQIASRKNQGVLRVNMNAQTTIGDFVGMWTVKAGETVWVDGVLPKAMKDGLWLIIDEIDFAEPAILSVLNAVLEDGGKLTLKEKGHEIIEGHDNFRIIATANGIGSMGAHRFLYQGTNNMNEAFLDRWRVYFVDYLDKANEVKVITSKFPSFSKQMAETVVEVANLARRAFDREELQSTFSLRKLLDWVELLVREGNVSKASSVALYSKISKEDAAVLENIINRVLV